jgi:hypothetical protein
LSPINGNIRHTEASILTIWITTVGSRIRIKLYSGKVVEAEITAITNQSAGRKVQIQYGSVTTLVSPAQIIEVFKYN